MNGLLNVRVQQRQLAAPDILLLTLESLDGSPLPAFDAGAHIDLELPNGIVRQYSLCSSPYELSRYALGILLEPESRGGSRSAHQDIKEGDIVRISQPRNLFALVPSKHAMLMAGGIGVTPMLAMVDHLHAEGASFELHYCVRTLQRAAFLTEMCASPYADKITVHFEDQPETALDVGALFATPDPGTHIYICGPGGFIDYVVGSAEKNGWASSNIHLERFNSSPIDHSGDKAFDIIIADTGATLTVEADETAIAAMARHGLSIPVSCEQGICGTCLLSVIDGTPDHRDMYLSDQERAANDSFLPCCSRAHTSSLTIQL